MLTSDREQRGSEPVSYEAHNLGSRGATPCSATKRARNQSIKPVDAVIETPAKVTGGEKDKSNGGLLNAKKCQLPGCGVEFTPSASAKDQRFCTVAHRALYWKLAANIGDKLIREGRSTVLDGVGIRHWAGILGTLQNTPNEWVPKNWILGGVWNSRRISDLRSKGHLIEHRMFQGESQYRLVVAE